jgi:hypothetical protein
VAGRWRRGRTTAPGATPDEVLRDDPLPLMPYRQFRPEADVILSTLARLPEVRQPWLRRIYDRITSGQYTYPF